MVDYTIITQGDLGESLEVKSVNGTPKVELKISNESNNALSLDQNGLFVNQNTVKAYTFNVSAQNDTFDVPHNGSALVYLNGVLLSPIHYDQSDSSKLVLTDPVENGVVRIITGLIQEIIVP